MNFTLNALQVVTFSYSTAYLSATEVDSSAPVAVFSGNLCGVGIANLPPCDFEQIMLTPEESWGTQFPFFPFAGTDLNEFILSTNQNTTVYRDGNVLTYMRADQYIVFNYPNAFISTDKPVEVVQVRMNCEQLA